MSYSHAVATWLLERSRLDIGLIGDLSENAKTGVPRFGTGDRC